MTKQRKRTAPVDFHGKAMGIARGMLDNSIEMYDGEKCFNLFTYIEALESRLVELEYLPELGKFQLSAHDMARYCWVCIALENGDCPSGTVPGYTFKGMPILD